LGAAGILISLLGYTMVVMVVLKIDGLRGTSKDQNRETKYTLPTSEKAYLVIRVSFHWHNFLHLPS
jgi:hypothetical protein